MLNTAETPTVQEKTADNRTLTTAEPPASRRAGGAMRLVRGLIQVALMLAVLAGSYVVMNRLLEARPSRGARPTVVTTIPVEAVTAARADQRPTISLYGEVAAARSVEIRPAVGGEVVSVGPSLRAGLEVGAGETLFSIDPFAYEGAVTEARANLAQTEASIAEIRARIVSEREQLEFANNQLELARTDLQRARQLAEGGALTDKGLEDRELVVSQREQAVGTRRSNLAVAEAQLDQQTAARERLQWGVRQAERNLEKTTVTAPFAGVISTSNVEEGRLLSANEVAVAIYDDEALEVRFTLTDAQYGRVATDNEPLIGREVDVAWNVGGVDYGYTAEVVRVGAEIASARGGVDVYAGLVSGEAPVQLRPGAFVSVTVPDRLYEDAYRLPETAIYDGNAVYVIVDGELQRRAVSVAAYDGADVIVADGIEPGDQILTTRLSRIENGLKVTVPADGAGSEGR